MKGIPETNFGQYIAHFLQYKASFAGILPFFSGMSERGHLLQRKKVY